MPQIIIPDLVIGLAGLPSSGKGTGARILEAVFPDEISVVSSGRIIQKILHKLGASNADDTSAQQNCYSVIKEALGDEKWLHFPIRKYWERSQRSYWIFDGVRMPWDVQFVQSYPRWIIFYLSCSMEKRFERAKLRSQKNDPSSRRDEKTMTWEYFRGLHEHETAKFVASIEHMRGVVTLDNNGTPRQMGSQIMAELLPNRCVLDPRKYESRKKALEIIYKEFQPQPR